MANSLLLSRENMRPLNTPQKKSSQPKKINSIDEICSYFEPFIYTSKLFNKDKIPSEFMEISHLIREKKHNKISDKISHLLNLYSSLQRTEIQIELCKKGKDYLQKCLCIVYIIAEYIARFYDVKLNNNGELESLEERKLDIKDLINCFEATKNFEDVKKGHTSGTAPALDISKNKNKLFSHENKSSLSQGGFEQNSLLSRIISGELVGIITCSIGSEGAGWSPYLPIPNPHAQAATAIVASDLVMMAGFSLMLVSSSSLGYKFNLQKMLLGNIYSAICNNKEEKEKLKGLSRETRLELKKLLPESLNFEPLLLNTEPKASLHTSVDAKFFFQQFLSSNRVTHLEIITKLSEIPKENHAVYINYLRTSVIKLNGIWGTILDHLFAKLDVIDRVHFNKQLLEKKELFSLPNDRESSIPAELTGKEGAINYVYNIMKNTPWADRKIGTQTLSGLLLDIYSCGLNQADKAFLLNIMLSKELEGKERGEFASGKQKKLGGAQSFGIGAFYTVTSTTAFIAGFFATPLASAIIKTISNGIGAMTFGWLGLHSHLGSSCSHDSKEKFVDIGVSLFRKQENDEPDSIQAKYQDFLALLKELKEFKKNKITPVNENYTSLVKRIHDFVDYFEKEGILPFVFEANHAEKNCPLFEIIETLLDVDLLKKMPTTEGDQTPKENALKEVSNLVTKIYRQKNKEIISAIKPSNSQINEEIFNIFVSEGYRKSHSSKDKFLFSLQCYAFLKKIKEEEEPIYNNCKSIFFSAVKKAAHDKSSLLYGLQKRHEKTYATRRVILRACVDMATVGLFGVLVGLSIFPLTSIFGVIGMAFFTAFLYGADFAGRKLGERLEYSTRIEVENSVIKRAYRYYESIRSIVDIEEECYNNTSLKNQQKLAKDSLKEVEELSLVNNFDRNKKNIIQALAPCLLPWEEKLDDEKVTSINTAEDSTAAVTLLRDEINFILRQGFDKDSVNHSIARGQRLILMCHAEKVSLNEKRLLLCELTYRTCIYGQLADILQTKAMWGSDQYLLADFGLGFLLGSLGIVMSIPELQKFYETVDASGQVSQSLSQFATQYTSQVVIDSITFVAWIHQIDISHFGKTNSFQVALGALKKTLTIFTPEDLLKEKIIELAKATSDSQKQEIEAKYNLANEAVRNIFKIQRYKIPSFLGTQSSRNHQAQEESSLV